MQMKLMYISDSLVVKLGKEEKTLPAVCLALQAAVTSEAVIVASDPLGEPSMHLG